MNTLDRYEFRNRYKSSPSKVSNCPVGESVTVNGHVLRVVEKHKGRDGFETLNIIDGDEEYLLDLTPHWERGPEGPIKCCHEGVMNLIKGVYAQTERDYEELYLNGEKGYYMEKLPGENKGEFERRRKAEYAKEIAKCEEFLGTIFTKFAKIKALWSISHDPNYIGEMVGESAYHTSCIIDRLGLNRKDLPDNDEEIY